MSSVHRRAATSRRKRGKDLRSRVTTQFEAVDTAQPARISPAALASLEAGIGLRPAEAGAILFTDRAGVIRAAEFDPGVHATGVTYTPDLNVVKAIDRWASRTQDLTFAGFAHSHPAGHTHPSTFDREYANRLMAFKGVDTLYLPIVQTVPDTGSFGIHWWRARHIEGPAGTVAAIDRIECQLALDNDASWLDRVHKSLDLGALEGARVVAAGVGGARSALEDLARCGVGQFVLIDPDVYTSSNLATQHARRSELGIGKAVAVAAAIRDINPDAVVVAIPGRVEEVLVGAARDALLLGQLGGRRPSRTLLGAWTDSHSANAFMAHVGLETGLPAVFADLFRGASAAAVALVAPGLTAGCHRCWVGRRYEFFESGGSNPIDSTGAEVWATSRLNSLKTRICLLVLQSSVGTRPDPTASAEAGPADPLLAHLAERPVAVVKLRPDVEELTGLGVFRRFEEGIDSDLRPAVALDGTLWLRNPARPGCPECGGSGDLRSCRAKGN